MWRESETSRMYNFRHLGYNHSQLVIISGYAICNNYRLRKNKGCNAVAFVEFVRFNSTNDLFFCMKTAETLQFEFQKCQNQLDYL